MRRCVTWARCRTSSCQTVRQSTGERLHVDSWKLRMAHLLPRCIGLAKAREQRLRHLLWTRNAVCQRGRTLLVQVLSGTIRRAVSRGRSVDATRYSLLLGVLALAAADQLQLPGMCCGCTLYLQAACRNCRLHAVFAGCMHLSIRQCGTCRLFQGTADALPLAGAEGSSQLRQNTHIW